jgi:hypothetical protein
MRQLSNDAGHCSIGSSLDPALHLAPTLAALRGIVASDSASRQAGHLANVMKATIMEETSCAPPC